jgi:predicted secreted acid phosphatase
VKLALPHRRSTRTATIALASAAVGVTLAVPGIAVATHSGQSVPAPPADPTSASQIQNIDQVKTAIKAYYGEKTTPGNVITLPQSLADEVGTATIHQFTADSAYAHEVSSIAARAGRTLTDHQKRNATKAVLFDVDDTTLNTYSYEIYSNFVYNPATNANFVNAADPMIFPAVPGMVALEKKAEADGYHVFFLTGRPLLQRDATVTNLTKAGYDDVTNDNVFTKDSSTDTEPWLASCLVDDPAHPGTKKFGCSTIQYKSLTRQHIEQDLGYDIVANFGDQYSDLKGGFADRTYKIPNPMYYLP